ncbi:MAG: hypothetical protein Q9160_005540 [Pyrenula sp. 1 TL-2023]
MSQNGLDEATIRNENQEIEILRSRERQMGLELAHKAQLVEYGPLYTRPSMTEDGRPYIIRCTLFDRRFVLDDSIAILRSRATTLDSFISELGRKTDPKLKGRRLKIRTDFNYMTLYYVTRSVEPRETRFVKSNDNAAYEEWIATHDSKRSPARTLLISAHLNVPIPETGQTRAGSAILNNSPNSVHISRSAEQALETEKRMSQSSRKKRSQEVSKSIAVTAKRTGSSENSIGASDKVNKFQRSVSSNDEDVPPQQPPKTRVLSDSSSTRPSRGKQQTQTKEPISVQTPSRRKTNNSWGAGMPPEYSLYNHERRDPKTATSDHRSAEIDDSMHDVAKTRTERNPVEAPRHGSRRSAKTTLTPSQGNHELLSLSDTEYNEEMEIPKALRVTSHCEPPQDDSYALFNGGTPPVSSIRNRRDPPSLNDSAKAKKISSSDEVTAPGGQKRRRNTKATSHVDILPSGELGSGASRNVKTHDRKASAGTKESPSKNRDGGEDNDTDESSESPIVTPRRRKKPTLTSMRKWIGS